MKINVIRFLVWSQQVLANQMACLIGQVVIIIAGIIAMSSPAFSTVFAFLGLCAVLAIWAAVADFGEIILRIKTASRDRHNPAGYL